MAKREEELARTKRMVLTREDTRAEADALFGPSAKAMRQTDTEMLRKLFIQAPAAQTMAPNLQGGSEKLGSASPAPSVDAFLEKVAASKTTDAQKLFPELLKVASPRAGTFKVPDTAPKKPQSPVMETILSRSMQSGGSA